MEQAKALAEALKSIDKAFKVGELTNAALEADMRAYYYETAQPDADFDTHYALLGAQRNTKIIGIFTLIKMNRRLL